ncbi:MAG: NAD(P)H-dependent glycerol-3-phosphate dehydrogenase [Planctomycetota bacterium]|jgi:glycerol-3-phosphate dehydrogenase (NAD(P)+)
MEAARKVVIVGDGGWGTALAMLLENAGREVAMWSVDPEYAALMASTRTNPKYLPGFEIPSGIDIGSELEALLPRADLLVSAIPTAFLRDVWSRHASVLPRGVPVVSVSKGLELGTDLRPTEIIQELTGERSVAVLSGPNIAREIADGKPAATVVSSADGSLTHYVQATFASERFRVYSNPDTLGVELGGVLKNVVALAGGICDGMKLGTNAKAALLTRGVIEMARLGETLGGQRSTFFGMAGLGDLLTTCYSPVSRNRTFGERLGRGERVEDIAASMTQVAEGVKTSAPVHDLMEKHGLPLPISEQVYLVIHKGKDPRDTVRDLMLRGHKDEAEDLL